MSGPNETIRPIPSWPPIWGVLILVIGFPSGPAAVPALVCRSGVIVRCLFVLSPTPRLAGTEGGGEDIFKLVDSTNRFDKRPCRGPLREPRFCLGWGLGSLP